MFTTSPAPRRHVIRMASLVVLGLIRFANVQSATVCTSIAAQLKSALEESISQTQPCMIAVVPGYRSNTMPHVALDMPGRRMAGPALASRAPAAPESGLPASVPNAQARHFDYVTRLTMAHRLADPSKIDSGAFVVTLLDDGVAKRCTAHPHHTDSFNSTGDLA